MGDNRSDNELIRAFQVEGGDEEAFPILFEPYKNLFLVWGNCICPNPADSQSLSLKASEVILNRLNAFDPGGELAFEAWLIQITVHSVFERYKDDIYRWAYYICHNRHDALEEIPPEVFIAISEYIMRHEYRGENAFKGWLRRITTNKAFDFVRRRNGELRHNVSLYDVDEEGEERPMEIPDENLSPDNQVVNNENDERIRAEYPKICEAIENLPEQQKKIASRYFFAGWKIREIAKKLDITEGAVKAHISQIRVKLRRAFQHMLDIFEN